MKSSLIIFLFVSIWLGLRGSGSGVEWSRANIVGLGDVQGEFASIAFTDSHGVANWEGSSKGIFQTTDGFNWSAGDEEMFGAVISFQGKFYSQWGHVSSDGLTWEIAGNLPVDRGFNQAIVLNEKLLYITQFSNSFAYSLDGFDWSTVNMDYALDSSYGVTAGYADGFYYILGGYPNYHAFRSVDLINWVKLEDDDAIGNKIFGLNGNILTFKEGTLNRIDSNLTGSLLWPINGTESPSAIVTDGVDYYIAADQYAETVFHLDSNFNQLSADSLPEGGWIEHLNYDPIREHVVVTGGYLDSKTNAQRPALWIRNTDVTPLARGAVQFSPKSFYSEWFGLYWELGSEWVYSERAKHLFVFPTSSEESTYLYSLKLGWLWTNQSYYPYVYLYAKSAWIYMMPQENGKMYWWDLETGSYASEE